MRRIGTIPLLLLPLALASCGGKSVIGTYSFQMGKQSSSHMTASLTLKDNVVENDSGEVLGKALVFYVEAKMGAGSSAASTGFDTSAISSEAVSTAESSDSSAYDMDDMLINLLGQGIEVDGYYDIESLDDGTRRLVLGFSLTPLEEAIGQKILIPPDVVEKIVYSTIDDKTITLKIPVSIEDLAFQLYWYGFDLGEDEPVAHPLNTHPTAADIEEINKTFPATHEGKVFRDFHCLSLGLKKN